MLVIEHQSLELLLLLLVLNLSGERMRSQRGRRRDLQLARLQIRYQQSLPLNTLFTHRVFIRSLAEYGEAHHSCRITRWLALVAIIVPLTPPSTPSRLHASIPCGQRGFAVDLFCIRRSVGQYSGELLIKVRLLFLTRS